MFREIQLKVDEHNQQNTPLSAKKIIVSHEVRVLVNENRTDQEKLNGPRNRPDSLVIMNEASYRGQVRPLRTVRRPYIGSGVAGALNNYTPCLVLQF